MITLIYSIESTDSMSIRVTSTCGSLRGAATFTSSRMRPIYGVLVAGSSCHSARLEIFASHSVPLIIEFRCIDYLRVIRVVTIKKVPE